MVGRGGSETGEGNAPRRRRGPPQARRRRDPDGVPGVQPLRQPQAPQVEGRLRGARVQGALPGDRRGDLRRGGASSAAGEGPRDRGRGHRRGGGLPELRRQHRPEDRGRGDRRATRPGTSDGGVGGGDAQEGNRDPDDRCEPQELGAGAEEAGGPLLQTETSARTIGFHPLS